MNVVVISTEDLQKIVTEAVADALAHHQPHSAANGDTGADRALTGEEAAQFIGVDKMRFYQSIGDMIPSVMLPGYQRPRWRMSDLRTFLSTLPAAPRSTASASGPDTDMDDDPALQQVSDWRAKNARKKSVHN